MTPLRERFIRDLELRNYRKTTQYTYVKAVERFARYFKRSPAKLGLEEIKQYFTYLREERGASLSYYKQTLGALRFLYTYTLGQPWMQERLKYPRQSRILPVVVSQEEVARLLRAIPDMRIRMAVTLIYATGLRLTEARMVKMCDIDSQRMVIRVRDGKGGKQRDVILSKCLLKELRAYWQHYRPKEYLLAGSNGRPLNETTIQDWCREGSKRAKLRTAINPRMLRHAYATHLLEEGTDIRIIQKLLGHNNINTTLVYTHVTSKCYKQVADPLKALDAA